MPLYADAYKEEIALSKLMKSDILVRPQTIKELKETKEYNKWILSLPAYIPYLFENPIQ